MAKGGVSESLQRTCLTKGRGGGHPHPPGHTPATPQNLLQWTREGGNPPDEHDGLNPRRSPAPGAAGSYKRGEVLLSRAGGEVQVWYTPATAQQIPATYLYVFLIDSRCRGEDVPLNLGK